MTNNIAVITGGAGFIGSNLAEILLEKGYRVRVIDNFSTGRRQNLKTFEANPNLEVVEADINDGEKIRKCFADADYVFHLAGLADIEPSIENPASYFKANVDGTLNIMEILRTARPQIKKIVYAASSSCYGIPAVFPTPEDSEIKTEYPYALTKNLGERIVLHWGKVYKLPVVSLRLFNVFGPRSRTSGAYGAVFGVFLAQKLAGRPFTVVGDGTQTRDFTFVSDAAAAFLAAAESKIADEIFNVGTGNPQSVNRLVNLLGGEAAYVPKRPGEPDCTQADITKIKKLLKWEPKTTFEGGVKILLENIDLWREPPVWTPEKIEKATREWFARLSA